MSIFDQDMAIKVLSNGRGVLTIPEGVTELTGDFALVFDWMPEKKCQFSFREIQIPSTVQIINGIFLTEYGPDEAPVKRFKKISVSKDNKYYTDVDGVLFSKDMTRLICYPCGKPGKTYVVPDSVEIIDEFAFGFNVNLQRLVLPNSLRRIETEAFFQCEKLSDINLPHGLEHIGEGCFALSVNINRLSIPSSIKQIPTSLFYEGSVVSVPNNEIELEYDYVPTEYLNSPFSGPAIISNHNEKMIEFAESYDYNHFEDCYEDDNGIIWAKDGQTLVCFPSEWNSEVYELPDIVKEVYINAFLGTSIKRFYSSHKVNIIGRAADTPRYYEPMTGNNFSLFAHIIQCDDKKENRTSSSSKNNNEHQSNHSDELDAKAEQNGNVPETITAKKRSIQKSNSMNRKYQVFVSSTYEDLIEERAAVFQCLLDCGCIPVGMEQFPASGMSPMEYIEKMLEDCDYYILILAGRYGSLDIDDIGFTEKEYEYAKSIGLPIMSFVIEDAGKLQADRCEDSDKGRALLKAFRNKVRKTSLVKMYKNANDLKAHVAVSLMKCIQDFPAVGWIRATAADSNDIVAKQVKEYLDNLS